MAKVILRQNGLPTPDFAVLNEVARSPQTWPAVAAKYGVDDPLPPWETSLDGFIRVLGRPDHDASADSYAGLPYPENRLVTLAHTLLSQKVIDEDDLRHRLTIVRARLEA